MVGMEGWMVVPGSWFVVGSWVCSWFVLLNFWGATQKILTPPPKPLCEKKCCGLHSLTSFS